MESPKLKKKSSTSPFLLNNIESWIRRANKKEFWKVK